MIDILLGIIWVFVTVVIVLVIGILVVWGAIKFFEFIKGEEGDDYKKWEKL